MLSLLSWLIAVALYKLLQQLNAFSCMNSMEIWIAFHKVFVLGRKENFNMVNNSDKVVIQHGAEGVCPECGGSLYTTDGIILECDTCEYVSSDMSQLSPN